MVVLDDLSGGFRENVPGDAEFVEGTVLDGDLIERLFRERKFDYVFHLAAYAAEGLSHFIRRFTYQNNLIGSINLINASINHAVKCFVFTSSIAVYGRSQLPMRETMTPMPEDPYGISKLAVEMDLRAAHEMFGLNYVIVRPHNVYGERQNIGDTYRNVLGVFMNQILQGRPLTIFGDGEQTRAFSHISDVAPVIAACPFVAAALNQVFNIGADQPYSVNELARVVRGAMGSDVPVQHLPARHEVLHAYAAHDKARAVFGMKPAVGLEEGVGRMARWVQLAGARSSREFGDIEVRRNLPAAWASRTDVPRQR